MAPAWPGNIAVALLALASLIGSLALVAGAPLHGVAPNGHPSGATAGDIAATASKGAPPPRSPRQHLLSIVVTNYCQNKLASRAVRSVIDSANAAGFEDFEVVVVHDGADNVEINMPEPYGAKVRELVKTHSGLASSRNYAIGRVASKYVMCLDGDDLVQPEFFGAVRPALLLGEADVVQTDMASADGKLLWAPPAYDPATLPTQNQFHASAIFRKSLWDEFGKYRAEFFFGWEDWDFWVRLSSARAAVGSPLVVENIRRPLFVYDAGSMHGFCVVNHAACRAVFVAANINEFPRAHAIKALLMLLDPAKMAPFWAHPQYALMTRTVVPASPLVNLLRGIELLSGNGDNADVAAAAEHFGRTLFLDPRRPAINAVAGAMGGLDAAAAFLVDQATFPSGIPADELVPRYDELDGMVARADNAAAGFDVKGDRGTGGGSADNLYHSFVSTDSGGTEMRAMLYVSLTSIMRFHHGMDGAAAHAYVWTNIAIDSGYTSGLGSHSVGGKSSLDGMVAVVPMSPLYFARCFGRPGDTIAVSTILHHFGSKFFRTHITDVLRYVVLLRLGGTYHDIDVVFRPALASSAARDAIGIEDYVADDTKIGEARKIANANGAVMLRFERNNLFMRTCLDSVVRLHNPDVYNSIGPGLVSVVAKQFIAEGMACVETTDRAGQPIGASCDGTSKPLTVLDTAAFYLFHWNDQGKKHALAEDTSVTAALEGREGPGRDVLTLHLWNGLWHPVRLALSNPGSVVGQLLEENGLSRHLAHLPPLDASDGYDLLKLQRRDGDDDGSGSGEETDPSTPTPTPSPTRSPLTSGDDAELGVPGVALELAVPKSLADFTSAEVASVKDGVIVYLTLATTLTVEQIIRVDLTETSHSRKRSTTTITATAVLGGSAGGSIDTAAAAASNATAASLLAVSFTLDNQTVTATPAVSATWVELRSTTIAPPVEVGDDNALSGGSIAAIVIAALAVSGLLVLAVRKNEMGKQQALGLLKAKVSGGAGSPRVSISEAFNDDALPAKSPANLELEADETYLFAEPTDKGTTEA